MSAAEVLKKSGVIYGEDVKTVSCLHSTTSSKESSLTL